ncbi:MAG: M1 family metallopeptidase [Clostridia bacterium]|nr:M1 family metallopeptidase [Clostridia bacterium]
MTADRRSYFKRIARSTICILLCCTVFLAGSTRLPAYTSDSETLSNVADRLTCINIRAVYHPDEHTLEAEQTVILINNFGMDVQELIFRTYANAFRLEETSPAAMDAIFDSCYPNGFSQGGILFRDTFVDGHRVEAVYADEAGTLLVIPLPSPLACDEAVTILLSYRIVLPECRYRFGYTESAAVFGNAFPMPALFEDGVFRCDEYYPIGDPFVSECADFYVSVTVPEGFTAMGSGIPVCYENTYTFASHAVRDFMLVLTDRYVQKMSHIDGVTVISYALSDAQAQKALDFSLRAMRIFSTLAGSFAYPSMTIVQTDFPFGGMEYPQCVLISRDLYQGRDSDLEWTCVHETAHQWFYAAVGSDQFNDPWQDEALCEYMVYEYMRECYGDRARDDAIYKRAELATRLTIPRGMTPGSPVTYFDNFADYTLVVYNRGSALFVALEEMLGRDLVYEFIRAYYQAYTYRLASRQDFESLLYKVVGYDLSGLLTDYLDTIILN